MSRQSRMVDPISTQEVLVERSTVSASGCWEWNGSRIYSGYGMVWKKKWRSAHRVSYEAFVAEIPAGLFICHRCDNPCCINPYHLYPGTAVDNGRDRVERGRHEQANKTHCIHGHSLEDAYRETKKNGRVMRVCRVCKKRAALARYYRKMALRRQKGEQN